MIKASAFRVEIEASPIFELLLQLNVFSGIESLDTFEVGSDWRDRMAARCSQRFHRALDRLGGPHSNLDQLIGIQMTQPAPSLPVFLKRLDQLPEFDVKLHLIGFYSDVYPEAVEAAILAAAQGGRKSRLTAARALTASMPDREAATARLLATPAEELKEMALEVVGEWYERIFASEEASVRRVLAADARAKRSLLGTDPERLILIATGISYRRRDRFGKSLLIPTLVMRPWVGVVQYKRTCIYAYPVTEDPTTPETARRGVARVFQALGDEQRLQIVKLLNGGELTLEQLSQRLDQPPHVVRFHIAVLRAGRIVQINCDKVMTYQLRGDIIHTIGQPLQTYLKLAPSIS